MEKFSEDISFFLEDLSGRKHLSANTIDAYRRDLHQYREFLDQQGCSTWMQVNEVIVKKFLYWIKDQGNAQATVARKATAVRRLHRFLMVQKLQTVDPTYMINVPKVESHRSERLSYPEVEQLLAAADTRTAGGRRDRAMMEVLYATGMHVSELIQLDCRDLNLMIGIIHCHGEKGGERILPLGKYAEQAVREYIEQREKEGEPLFINHRGQRLTRQGVWKILKRYAEIAGIRRSLSPETLRQTLAAHLLENGADLQSVETLLGRTSLLTAEHLPAAAKPLLKDFYRQYHPRA
ncbi:MAG: tyrosine-type recombinase/integrase [Sporolactobacillus sp.]